MFSFVVNLSHTGTNTIKKRYGATGPEISRQYISLVPPSSNSTRTEIHYDQWHIKAIDELNGEQRIVPSLKTCTVGGLKEACCSALEIDPDEVEIFGYASSGGSGDVDKKKRKSLEELHSKTLISAHIKDRQTVLLRRKDHPEIAEAAAAAKRQALMATTSTTATATTAPMSIEQSHNRQRHTTTTNAIDTMPNIHPHPHPLAPILTTTATSPPPSLQHVGGSTPPSSSPSPLPHTNNPSYSSPRSRSYGKPPIWAEEDVIVPLSTRRPGLAGLGNLGNTCFMNSSIQCLAHTPPLMRTFLSNAYRRDLNRDNPLGLGGKLALAFGGLMGKLWRGGVGHVAPKHFKWQLGKFAPQFGGYAQQDSQELLAFLLDGLHEDLNRIAVKPYREEKDSDGRPDEEVAGEAWDNYRARNDSVVVDHFQGLLKSTLRCPVCSKTSVKFDPFMYLSLPLPTPKTRALMVTVVDVRGVEAPVQIAVDVMKTGTIADVVAKTASILNSSSDNTTTTEQHLLLASWNANAPSTTSKIELYTDPANTAISTLPTPGERRGSGGSGGFFRSFSFSSNSNSASSGGTVLVAYRFKDPIPIDDPQARPLVLFHRTSSNSTTNGSGGSGSTQIVGVPAVFFWTPDHLQNNEQGGVSNLEAAIPMHEVKEKSGMFGGSNTYLALNSPNVFESLLDSFLRPFVSGEGGDTNSLFQRAMYRSGQTEAQAQAEVEKSKESEQEMMDVDGRLHSRSSSMPADLLDPLFDANTAATEEQVKNNQMAVDGDSRHAMQSIDTDTTTGAVDVERQQQEENNDDNRVVRIVLGQDNGQPRTFYYSTSNPDLSSSPLYFIAEWDPSATALLDLTPWTHPTQHESAVQAAAKSSATSLVPRTVTLDDCVEAFLQPERLDASDSWYCSECKTHVRAEKKLDLWRLPEVLVVHLKRFSYNRYSRDKLDTVVDFPLEGLDLSQVVLGSGNSSTSTSEQNVYDLYAVSNHYGGLGGGHYTAYCKMPDDGQWHTFDDSSVSDMDPEEVKSTAAYVLFYRRRGAQDGDLDAVVHAASGGSGGGREGIRAGDAVMTMMMEEMPMDDDVGGFSMGRRVCVLEQVDEEGGEGDGNGNVNGNENQRNGQRVEEEGEEEEEEGKAKALTTHAILMDDDDLNLEDLA